MAPRASHLKALVATAGKVQRKCRSETVYKRILWNETGSFAGRGNCLTMTCEVLIRSQHSAKEVNERGKPWTFVAPIY